MGCRHLAETTRRVNRLHQANNLPRETSCQLKLSSSEQRDEMNLAHARDGLGSHAEIGTRCPYDTDAARQKCPWRAP